jgi:hypothetical protein
LQTSLTKLKNAWDQLLMGLANNEIIKFAVDSLTTILTVINKIIEGISGGNGLIKSLTTLIATFSALKLGKGLFEKTGVGSGLGKLFGKGRGE